MLRCSAMISRCNISLIFWSMAPTEARGEAGVEGRGEGQEGHEEGRVRSLQGCSGTSKLPKLESMEAQDGRQNRAHGFI